MCYPEPGPKCAQHVLKQVKNYEPDYDPMKNPGVESTALRERLDSTAGGQQLLLLAIEEATDEETRAALNRRLNIGIETWAIAMWVYKKKLHGRTMGSIQGHMKKRMEMNAEALEKTNPLNRAVKENEAHDA